MQTFNNLSRQLQKYYDQSDKADDALERAMDKMECYSCDKFRGGLVDNTIMRFMNCDCKKRLKISQLAKSVDRINAETEDFILNTYAKEVFEQFSKIQPMLVNDTTGENCSWEEAFGTKFEDVPKTLRYSLVGLIENTGRYRLKQDDESPTGD